MFTKIAASKLYMLISIILLVSGRIQMAQALEGCGFCDGGTLSNPEALISLSSPDEIHSCLEWQRRSILTEGFAEETCEFIGPFYDAICGCSNVRQFYDQCNLCGTPEMVFGKPLKGLAIPNSNNQHILCRTIYSGVQMGAVPPKDCQVLAGITDFCGGCVTTADSKATLAPTIEKFIAETSLTNLSTMPSMEPSASPIINPSSEPSSTSTMEPSASPSVVHSSGPTIEHSSSPTSTPSAQPSAGPSTAHSSTPSSTPTMEPSASPSVAHSSSPTVEHSSSPTSTPSAQPSTSPSVVHSSAPTLTPTMGPSASPSVAHSSSPTVEHSSSPTSTPSAQPSASPSVVHSSTPSSAPTMEPSASPSVAHSSSPTTTPSVQPSAGPTIEHSSTPTSTPTNGPTASPTVAHSASPSIEHSSSPSVQLSTDPTSISSSPPSEINRLRQSTLEEFAELSKVSATCDLCPGSGILARPDKKISLLNVGNKTVTKSCGALLWDTRKGRNNIDEVACSFLQPFFGATCGCSTFSSLLDIKENKKADNKKGQNKKGELLNGTKNCRICKNPRHVFQAPYQPLTIPGSNTTRITCGGLFTGAVSGAVTTSGCVALGSVADNCGGCGPDNTKFYVEPEVVKKPQEVEVQKKPQEVEPSPPEQCIDCLGDNESSIYIYKDFGKTGTTFQKAFSAPLHCLNRKNKHQEEDCSRLLYPELESCVLAPITSFGDLLRVQSVIPPGKAAYTAVHKDRLIFKMEAEKCFDSGGIGNQSSMKKVSGVTTKDNCKVENWMDGLAYGYGDNDKTRSYDLNNIATVQETCESLKSGWINYNSGTPVPSSLWKDGQPSYCNLGPIQEVGAVWAVEADGQNYGDLRDVSINWPLPGAVYKCCKTIYSCFAAIN